MKKSDKKRRKKKDKARKARPDSGRQDTSRIEQLEKSLKKCLRRVEGLTQELSRSKQKKPKRGKAGKLLAAQKPHRVGVAQREAWKRHGYLRERYEFHLEAGRNKDQARGLANSDLQERFGEEAGYTSQELEQILS